MASAAFTLHFGLSLITPKLLSAKLSHFPSLSLKPLAAKPLSVTSHRPRFLLRHVAEFDRALTDSLSTEEAEEEEVNFSEDLKIFVGNLPFSVDSASLAGVFEQAGNVEMVEVIYDKQTGRSRGFGFVTMSTVEDVETAVQKFNGYELEGRALRVNAGPPPPKSESPFRAPRGGGGGGSFDNNNKVYVGNLSWGVDDLALRTLFSEQGQVMEARVIYDRDSGRSKGFGFVTYGSADEVNNAIESLDGVDLDGRPIRVSVAESRPPRRQF